MGIEDFIDARANLIAYERFKNFEIVAGGFLVRTQNDFLVD